MSKSYYQKLKSPKWQKKRLEVLHRDDFSCSICGDKNSTLHIHHIQYRRVKDPWDYPLKYLTTLCENCNEEEGLYEDHVKDEIVDLFNLGMDNGQIGLVLCAIKSIKKSDIIDWDKFEEYLIDLATGNEIFEVTHE